MLAVIADDITGAAEMAGIAHRYGLSCQMNINIPSHIDTQHTDILVIATDARSYTAQKAYDITASITRQLYAMKGDALCLFRKTDSALRGNVKEELQAIIDNSPYTSAVYMPANPSKGRIIKDGIYYIRTVDDIAAGHPGTPLSETDFRFDPEFPAISSAVKERFPGLTCPDATSQEDIDNIVESIFKDSTLQENTTLMAGAADLFTSVITHLFPVCSSKGRDVQGIALGASKLIVRGSTQSKAIDLGIPVETMPLDVFYEQAEPCTWAAKIISRLRQATTTQHPSPTTPSFILTIGDKEVRTGKHAAVYLRKAMAEVTCAVLSAHTPDELIIEGGATAFAILSQTPWHSFRITEEIAPGVVRMQPITLQKQPSPLGRGCDGIGERLPTTHITLKPGSYDWGKLFAVNS